MHQLLFSTKRKQILLLIFIAAIIFITFQFFSHEALSYFTRHTSHSNHDDNSEVDIKIVRGNRHKGMPMEFEMNQNNADRERYNTEKKKTKERDLSNVEIPRGVHKSDLKYFVPDEKNMFHCKDKKQTIPFSWVNDDSCDCEDFSDEPGTSACPNSSFYCGVQIPDKLPQSVPSSRVNDGICDCCDGSDEWSAIPPNKDVVRAASRTATVLVVPCKNLCDKVIQRKEEDTRIRNLGKRQQAKYLEAASSLSEKDKQEFGPNGIFYKLSETCYPFKSSGYEYTVCPFKSIKQQQFPRASISIGKYPIWKHMSDGLYILNMERGDSQLCPDGTSRTSVITFMCGITDRVVAVMEEERCTYGIKFATPAAC